MKKTINTRTKYKIVGSDYSGQELRLAAFLSQDKTLLDAYAHNQDAYAIIASQIFNVPYEDCLEFHKAGTELEIDGKKVIAGNGEVREYNSVDNTIEIKYYELLDTPNGFIAADRLAIGDILKATDGRLLQITSIQRENDVIQFIFKVS